MSPLRLPLERIVPCADELPLLEERARRLAGGAGAQAETRPTLLVVRFALAGRTWALEACALERVLAALGPVHALPAEEGPARAIAFLEEDPVPVLDLCGLEGTARPPRALERAPALVMRDLDGPLALAVEGPLDLEELAVTHSTTGLREAGLPVAGRLADGTLLLDGEDLRQRASRAVRGG